MKKNKVNMKNVLFAMLLLSGLTACKKDKEQNNVDSKIYFTGVTLTNSNGGYSKKDTTDWRFDDKWTTKEENLFATKYTSSITKSTASIMIFPNPIHSVLGISLNNMNSERLEVRLVDKDFNVLLANDSIMGTILLSPTNISEYDTLRLYYKLINLLNIEYKGHGDILIEKK